MTVQLAWFDHGSVYRGGIVVGPWFGHGAVVGLAAVSTTKETRKLITVKPFLFHHVFFHHQKYRIVV